MSHLIQPLVSVMNKLNFKQRFSTILLVIAIGIGLISFFLVHSKIQDRNLIESKTEPAEFSLLVSQTIKEVEKIRLAQLSALAENTNVNLDFDAVNQKILMMSAFESTKWQNIKAKNVIHELQSNINDVKNTKDFSQSILTYGKISNNLNHLLSIILAESGLALPSSPLENSLINIFSAWAPESADSLSFVRDNLKIIASNREVSQLQRDKIANSLGEYGFVLSKLKEYLDFAQSIDPNLKASMQLEVNGITNGAGLMGEVDKILSNAFSEHDFQQLLTQINTTILQYYQLSDKAYEQYKQVAQLQLNKIDRDIIAVLAVVLITLTLISVIFIAFYLSTNDAVSSLLKIANSIASGDLTTKFNQNRSDEFGVLMQALQNMQKTVSQMIQRIKSASNVVGRGSLEISQGNLDLSKRTEQQASSLASTAASMEELSITVKENAEQSKKSADLAEGARQKADLSGRVVNEAVHAMAQINDSSKKIADISNVIDDIAFQTNLLALNAAIEAARAGEQGRGFAVVAQEVRNLAQRSSTAAKEISQLINNSVENISIGTELVNKSGAALDEIVNASISVSDLVASIATATNQQAKGLEEMNKAITQMDSITQQNAALVEETAATSENVNIQVKDLIQLINYFKSDQVDESIEISKTMVSDNDSVTQNSKPEYHGGQNIEYQQRSFSNTKPKRLDPQDQDWTEF